MRPVAAVLADTLAGARFPGVGPVKARALLETFGERLSHILTEEDTESLTRVVSPEVAGVLVRGWRELNSSDVIAWLDQHRFPVELARRLLDFYGETAVQKLKADPYRLLAFGQSWSKVDHMAREQLNIDATDSRREHAAVAEVLFRAFDRDGSTALHQLEILEGVEGLLRGSRCQALRAIENRNTSGGWIHDDDSGLYQACGAWLMERYVADRLARMIRGDDLPKQFDAFHVHPGAYTARHRGSVWRALKKWEGEQHVLGDDQKAAIWLALTNSFAVISGGAGVGKTTVLNALYTALGVHDDRIVQMALSGRAAKRMRDATGRPALTIAGFLNRWAYGHGGADEADRTTADLCTYVVDEASMLGLQTLYKLLRLIGPGGRLLLVGDDMQLPPIEAGLTFHRFCQPESSVPQFHMKQNYRQANSTGLPAVCNLIRDGTWPRLQAYGGPGVGVSVAPCASSQAADLIAGLYDELVYAEGQEDQVQVLSVTRGDRRETPLSVVGVNKNLYERRLIGRTPIKLPGGPSGFCEGCPVLFTENDSDRGLNNGSLGRIVKAFERHEVHADGEGSETLPVCLATFDGEEHLLTEEDFVRQRVMRAYSMTVHKSQGSQWSRVIVLLERSVLLDRTLIYTAVTRATRQVVLVGDIAAAATAVAEPPRAQNRLVGLKV